MKYPLDLFRESIKRELASVLSSLKYTLEINLEIPPNPDKGDLSFACFPIAKIAKKSPNEIAEYISSNTSKGGWIGRISSVGGYVNFFIDTNRLISSTIKTIRSMDSRYGELQIRNKKIIIEHTSANPNGPLHVGRARNPILGDTLVRLYRFAGYDVESQFYIDDLGKQVAILAWGIKNVDPKILSSPSKDKPDYIYVRFYQKAYKMMNENERIKDEIEDIVRSCEKGNPESLNLMESSYKDVLGGIKQSLARLNIHFDSFVKESKFVRDGTVYDVVKKLQSSEYSKEENGAWYIDLEPFGVKGRDTRFFFTRSDGTTLYATRDVAYHLWKAKHADVLLNVLGEDHKLEAKQVKIALEIIGSDKIPDTIFYAFVTLPEGKMSTRRGRVVYLDDLVDESVERAYEEVKKRRSDELDEDRMQKIAEMVGIGSVRYNIIKIQPEKDIVFRWDDALNFEGNSAPFIQYSHARACSILSKEKPDSNINADLLSNPQEILLIKMLARFPDVIDESVSKNRPNILASYLYETASQFNQFYRDCPVLKARNSDLKRARLSLVDSFRIVVRNGLNLLGIEAPEEM